MKKASIASPFKKLFIPLIVLVVFGYTNGATAALITSSDSLTGTTSVIDFTEFLDSLPVGLPVPPAYLQIGNPLGEDIRSFSGGATIDVGIFGLSSNGFWDGSDSARNAYARISGSTTSIGFEFVDGPVSGVGVFLNYAPGISSTIWITAWNSNGDELEEYNISSSAPIITTGETNGGAFRGFQRPDADIRWIGISGSYLVLDDLEFTREVVPIPGAAWLLGSGLIGLMALRRKLKT